MLQAKLQTGSLTLKDDVLVFEWQGLRPTRHQRRASPHRLPLDQVKVVEARLPSDWWSGWVRFGRSPLGGTPLSPPSRDLDWIWLDSVDPNYADLVRIVEEVARRLNVPNPITAPPAVKAEGNRDSAKVRTFNIHALGPSGSGKTVFLASLYARLRLRRPDLAFYLKSDPETSLSMNTIYNQVANPAESWPEASQAVNEWRFRTCVGSAAGDFEPLEFVYLDYPGGVLTNPRALQEEGVRSLVERLRAANALLVLLDGQAILSLMKDERAGQRYMEFDLTSSLEIAQQSRCPVHFTITKWDLLHDKYSLGEVRARLMQDENFANLLEAKRQDMPGTIRLIPTSAVGFGFAELMPSGEMRKTGESPRPYQVDLPLLAVFPDFFQFAFDELKGKEADLAEVKQAYAMQRLLDPTSTSKVKGALRGLIKKALPQVQQALVQRNPALASVLKIDSDWLIDDVLNYAERLVKNRAERAEQGRAAYAEQIMRARQEVASERDALQLLERQCERIVSDFEIANPESVLAGGLERFEPDHDWLVSFRSSASASVAEGVTEPEPGAELKPNPANP